MLHALFLAAVAAAATPAPAATPLKVIITVKSNSLCTAVKSVAVPIGYVNKRNDEAFSAIDWSMLKFLQDNPAVSPVTTGELEKLGTAMDDDQTYTPENGLSVVQIGKIVYDIHQNLVLEDGVMSQSWKEYPRGAYPAIDSMRQRLQNLIDLQRALANQYLVFTSTYLDNRGGAGVAVNPANFSTILRSTIYGMASALASARMQKDPEVLPQPNAHGTAISQNTAAIARELRLQEIAFSQEISVAGTTCGY